MDPKRQTRVDTPTLLIASDAGDERILIRKCKLLALNGPLQGTEFIVEKDVFTVGSGPQNDLIIEDSTMSRRHCQISLVPNGYTIRDLGSTNGTYVQGVRVSEAFLDVGTEFQLGETRIVFCPMQEAMEYTLSPHENFGALLGTSVSMRRTFHLAEIYSKTDATVMVEGETGTGKEVIAEAIHNHSDRRDRPFVVIDCAALAKDLVESELFGHKKGAFTGAGGDRVGAFEHANGGTVFLDEIGELSPDLQPRLLRVLEKREIRPLGSNKVKDIDVRIICATNRRLEAEVSAGRFREDLFYRLSVVRIELPPLRRRKEDIPLLTRKFLKDFLGDEAETEVTDLEKATETFYNHDWPGNVRELRNLIEIACYTPHRPINLAAFLYPGKMKTSREQSRQTFTADVPFKDAKQQLISEFEQAYITDLLRRHNGNISQAARSAGIERAYLQRLIRKYGMSAK